jgi:hypothetical protein
MSDNSYQLVVILPTSPVVEFVQYKEPAKIANKAIFLVT